MEVLSDDEPERHQRRRHQVADRDVDVDATNVDDIVNLDDHGVRRRQRRRRGAADRRLAPRADRRRGAGRPRRGGRAGGRLVPGDRRAQRTGAGTSASSTPPPSRPGPRPTSTSPSEGIAPAGGDTPEAAMDTFLDAVADLDLRAMVAALNPDEFEALQRYAPLFIDEAQEELDDAIRESTCRSTSPTRPTTSPARGRHALGARSTALAVDDHRRGRDGDRRASTTGAAVITCPDRTRVELLRAAGRRGRDRLDDISRTRRPIEDAHRRRSRPRSTTTRTPASSSRRSTAAGTSARWRRTPTRCWPSWRRSAGRRSRT